MRGSEKATRALKISGAPFPNARKVTPWGERVKGPQCRGSSLPRPFPAMSCHPVSQPPALTALHPSGTKDTATLWESLSVVEMADKLGQKLWRKGKQ